MKEYNLLIDINANKSLGLSKNQSNFENNDKPQSISKINENNTSLNNSNQKSIDTIIEDDSIWLSGELKDKLYLRLASVKKDGKKKYDEQAKYLLYRIPVYQPTPYFIINESNLSPRLIKELASLTEQELDEVIKDVLSQIFESINKDYFLLSVHRYNLLRWRIEP